MDWFEEAIHQFQTDYGLVMIFFALLGISWELQKIRELLGGIRQLADHYQKHIDDREIERTLNQWPPNSN